MLMTQQIFLGPPGTGKTTTLLHTVEKLIDEGIHPTQIAFCSFTKKAAMEAKERAVEKFPGLDVRDLPYWNTLHSICFRRLGVQSTDVMGRADWKEISERTGFEMSGYYNVDDGQLAGGTLEGDRFLFHYGLSNARMKKPFEHYQSLHRLETWNIDRPNFLSFCDTLTQYKKETGKLDFDDMLEFVLPLGAIPGIRVAIIDEAQDLSLKQWFVVRRLFAECDRVIIAGDDDQSIYEWSGADLQSFLELTGETSVLEKSYRLPRSIYDIANRIIDRVQFRYSKKWRPDDREGMVQFVPNAYGDSLASMENLKERITDPDSGSWLILARNAYLLKDAQAEFEEWGVPYAYKTESAIDQKHIDAIMSYERVRGGHHPISPAQAQSFYNLLKGGVQIKRGFKNLPLETMPDEVTWTDLVVDYGLTLDTDEAWYTTLRIPNEKKSYYRALRRNGYSVKDGKDKIVCSTIHSVKGGEADNVVVIDAMAKRTFMEYEQVNPDAEHRVQYVAATRARHNLFILETDEPNVYKYPR
jgi:superfamily I DNA/RNA helicase